MGSDVSWRTRRLELIEKKHNQGLSDDEREELGRLNARMDCYLEDTFGDREDERLAELETLVEQETESDN